MVFFLFFRLVSSVGAFLYPGYASYKTLSQRPASEEELERWLMYWSVLGCLVGIEYVAEWLISWIPFYFTLKTIFLLYLALPQTQGSSYIYIQHLSPFFKLHEKQIDAAIASLRARVYTFVQERIKALWDYIMSATGQQPATIQDANVGAPPTLHDPASGPAQLISSLWTTYGPTIVASGTALIRQATVGATATRSGRRPDLYASPEQRSGARRGEGQQALLDRKRRLEAELATLSEQTLEPVLTPSASPATSSRGSSDSDVRRRERKNSGGNRFEEIEVPSDIEGYDVGQSADSDPQLTSTARTSWFAWSGSQKGGSGRVKSD